MGDFLYDREDYGQTDTDHAGVESRRNMSKKLIDRLGDKIYLLVSHGAAEFPQALSHFAQTLINPVKSSYNSHTG